MVKLNALPLVLRIKHVIHCPGSIPYLFNATVTNTEHGI